jgi:hypothetical protein
MTYSLLSANNNPKSLSSTARVVQYSMKGLEIISF